MPALVQRLGKCNCLSCVGQALVPVLLLNLVVMLAGVKVMTKSLTRSSSSPGHSAGKFYERSLGQSRGSSGNSPRGSRLYPANTPPMASAAYPFWSSEGVVSAGSMPSGEVPMVQSMTPSMAGMVPVVSSQPGGLYRRRAGRMSAPHQSS